MRFTLKLRNHICKREEVSLPKELFTAQFLLNSCRTKRMFMTIANRTVRTGMCQEDFFVRYIIIYTNDRTVQGHRVYCIVSKVNIFSQGNVQGEKPTYPMQGSTAELYH